MEQGIVGEEDEREKNRSLSFALSLALGVVVILIVTGIGILWVSDDLAKAGQFGDMFGGANALFSGLAFVGVIYAILLQSKELELQREELKMTRKEMELARAQYQKSADAQEDLVEKQMLNARITGVSAIVQGRYQLAAAFGANATQHVKGAQEAEDILDELLEEAGLAPLDLTPSQER